jgi:HPt (histidine-containing phosphotransfer) domain-containing protein
MTSLIVDKKALLERVENDAEFLQTVIGIFLAECPGMLAEIHSAVAAYDANQIMNAAHALKGSVSFFGGESAVEAARVLESMGRLRKLEGVREAFCVLEREIALVSFALEEIAKGTADSTT